ncbi:MAG: hypothetical protein Q4A98_00670 [Comamonadaceae bacterium]|nr:hypothetical protein [Comamonadaceae bacterium]
MSGNLSSAAKICCGNTSQLMPANAIPVRLAKPIATATGSDKAKKISIETIINWDMAASLYLSNQRKFQENPFQCSRAETGVFFSFCYFLKWNFWGGPQRWAYSQCALAKLWIIGEAALPTSADLAQCLFFAPLWC